MAENTGHKAFARRHYSTSFHAQSIVIYTIKISVYPGIFCGEFSIFNWIGSVYVCIRAHTAMWKTHTKYPWINGYFLQCFYMRVPKRDRSGSSNHLGTAGAVCTNHAVGTITFLEPNKPTDNSANEYRNYASQKTYTKNPHYKLIQKMLTAYLNVQQIRQNNVTIYTR